MNDNVVKTEYGYEIIWADTDDYVSKILVFENANQCLPLHFHRDTEKTWFVNAGTFKVQWVDTKDAKAYAKELPEGSVFHVPVLMPVSLKSLSENAAMAETRNQNNTEDYYRLN